MKFSLVAVSAAFFVLSSAQDLSGLPKCAQTCVGSSLGGCNPLDIKCICSNKAFITNISCCIAGKCSAADQKATITFANQICAVAQVTLPQAAGCSATSGSSGTGASGSGSSSAASSSSMAMSMSMSSSSSVTANPSSAQTAASAVSTSPSESASGANIQSATTSSAGSSSATSSSAAPASTSGAASHVGIDSAMGLAGLAAAAFALL